MSLLLPEGSSQRVRGHGAPESEGSVLRVLGRLRNRIPDSLPSGSGTRSRHAKTGVLPVPPRPSDFPGVPRRVPGSRRPIRILRGLQHHDEVPRGLDSIIRAALPSPQTVRTRMTSKDGTGQRSGLPTIVLLTSPSTSACTPVTPDTPDPSSDQQPTPESLGLLRVYFPRLGLCSRLSNLVFQPPPPPKALSPGVPMDVDHTRSRPATSQLCYRCGKPGHMSRECPLRYDVRS